MLTAGLSGSRGSETGVGTRRGFAANRRPQSGLSTLRRVATIPRDLGSVFAFFADASNLEKITPSWLEFRILTPLPIEMRAGTVIDYRIVAHGLPMRWRSVIDAWEPGVRFVDRQVRGPYRWWRHEHRFRAVEAGTLVEDIVEYRPAFAPLSGWIVRRDLERIFDYRARRIGELLGEGTSG